MKRIISAAAGLLSAVLFTVSAGAYSITGLEVRDENGDIVNHEGGHFQRFEKADGTLMITDFTDTMVIGNLVVPTKINGRTVTEIREYSFGHVEEMTSLTIPGSVTYVGKGAFQNCRDLETVVIESGTLTLDQRVFAGCESLCSVTVPVSVISLGEDIFDDCGKELVIYYQGGRYDWDQIEKNTADFENISVEFAVNDGYTEDFRYIVQADGTASIISYSGYAEKVVIPSEIDGYPVTRLESYSFSYNNYIYSVEIPSSVKFIDASAFRRCEALESVALCEGVEIIGEGAFAECRGLESVTIPGTVIRVDAQAFEYCEKLTEMIIPDSVEFIGDHAFAGCEELERITLGKNIIEIGEYAFSGCESLLRIEIPDKVTLIEKYTFQNCSDLKEIVIPESVNRIGYGAFARCYDLKRTYYKGSRQQWNEVEVGSENKKLTGSNIFYSYDPETYKPAGAAPAVIICAVMALVPVAVVVILVLKKKPCCPVCGEQADDNSKFCSSCGNEL